jgi:hypothetical protein
MAASDEYESPEANVEASSEPISACTVKPFSQTVESGGTTTGLFFFFWAFAVMNNKQRKKLLI